MRNPNFGLFYASGYGASAFSFCAVPNEYSYYANEFSELVVKVAKSLEDSEPGFSMRVFGLDIDSLQCLDLSVEGLSKFPEAEIILNKIANISTQMALFVDKSSEADFSYSIAQMVSEDILQRALKYFELEAVGDLEGGNKIQLDDILLQNCCINVDLRFDPQSSNVFVVVDLKPEIWDLIEGLSSLEMPDEILEIYYNAIDKLPVTPTRSPHEDKARALTKWADFVVYSADFDLTQEFEAKFGSWSLANQFSDDIILIGKIQDATGFNLNELRDLNESISSRLRDSLIKASIDKNVELFEWKEVKNGKEIPIKISKNHSAICNDCNLER